MTTPRFQFTITNVLWATFWVAVSSSFWGLAYRTTQPEMGNHALMGVVSLFAMFVGYFSSFAALGALFDKTLQALALGWITGLAGVFLYCFYGAS